MHSAGSGATLMKHGVGAVCARKFCAAQMGSSFVDNQLFVWVLLGKNCAKVARGVRRRFAKLRSCAMVFCCRNDFVDYQ